VRREFKRAAELPPDYCFPARLEEIEILQSAIKANPNDSRAPYYLGNLFYDRRRHVEAIALWERSVKLNPRFSVAWRNLGLGYFNIFKKPLRARAAYKRAFEANPTDARLLFEQDQLWKRMGEKPQKRLQQLEKHSQLVRQRDDLTVELCALYNQTGQHEKALQLVSSRAFQPWEGGEGGPLGQHVRAHLALGRAAFAHRDFHGARGHFEKALTSSRNLGEAKHLLANQSDIHYWLGCALKELGETSAAQRHWRAAASFKGDFQEMRVRSFSEMTYYSALSWQQLGKHAEAKKLFRELLKFGKALEKTPAKIDYFATSLPAMLLFEDDLQARQHTAALFLQAQAQLGLGETNQGSALLQEVLKRDPNHAMAYDFWNQRSLASSKNKK
jgi:tetratricopeptide (TPR) repeat protein